MRTHRHKDEIERISEREMDTHRICILTEDALLPCEYSRIFFQCLTMQGVGIRALGVCGGRKLRNSCRSGSKAGSCTKESLHKTDVHPRSLIIENEPKEIGKNFS